VRHIEVELQDYLLRESLVGKIIQLEDEPFYRGLCLVSKSAASQDPGL